VTKTLKSPVRVGLVSLGCAKNLADAEIMLGSLLKAGLEITNEAALADVVIVNTCSFIDAAQEESVDAILQSAELRARTRPGQALIVSGCLPQRFRDDLPALLPEVDAFMGIDQVAQAADIVQQALARRREKLAQPPQPPAKSTHAKKQIVGRMAELDRAKSASPPSATASPLIQVNLRPNYIPDYATPRFRLTPKHFAYLKIADGCNHPCSFCIIPQMRGSHRSRIQSDIAQEARQLIADGVKELNLISQDSTYYGLDLRPNASRAISSPEKFSATAKSLAADATTLCTLLRELNGLPGKFWVRLLYTHPAHWTDELMETIAQCPKVARYVDMPLQHIHENMLERMRRETSRQYIVDLIARIRAAVPGITLRTTFIVGFPGETEACFQDLLDFIRETKFERMGVFAYSKQDGTRAGRMEGQISRAVKERRQKQAMAEQLKISRRISGSFVGREIEVLIEGEATREQAPEGNIRSWEHNLIRSGTETQGAGGRGRGPWLVARSQADAPDIDGRVYVGGQLPLGGFARVKIVGHTDYDLIAKPI
jgi:ribosomal protein S12 methylthiotransferase